MKKTCQIILPVSLLLPVCLITLVGPETRYDISLPVWQLLNSQYEWVSMGLVSNIGHYAAFFLLSLVCLRVFYAQRYILLMMLIFLCAASEWLQVYVPGRDSNLQDVLINIVGVMTALVLQTIFVAMSSQKARSLS